MRSTGSRCRCVCRVYSRYMNTRVQYMGLGGTFDRSDETTARWTAFGRKRVRDSEDYGDLMGTRRGLYPDRSSLQNRTALYPENDFNI